MAFSQQRTETTKVEAVALLPGATAIVAMTTMGVITTLAKVKTITVVQSLEQPRLGIKPQVGSLSTPTIPAIQGTVQLLVWDLPLVLLLREVLSVLRLDYLQETLML